MGHGFPISDVQNNKRTVLEVNMWFQVIWLSRESMILISIFHLTFSQVSCGINNSSVLVISPPRIYLNRNKPKQPILVTCKQPPIQNAVSKTLKLTRSSPLALTKTDLAEADTTGLRVPESPGISVQGHNTAIDFTIREASCGESQFFFECDSTATVDTKDVHCTRADRFRIFSDPQDASITADPSVQEYDAGVLLTLTCTATVGLAGEDEEEGRFVWEQRAEGGSWSEADAYVGLGTLKIENSCLKVRSSKLMIRLADTDDGKSYRCYVLRDTVSVADSAPTFGVKMSKTASTVILTGVYIILFCVLVSACVILWHWNESRIFKEQVAFSDIVLNRLERLIRYDTDLYKDNLKKKRSIKQVVKITIAVEEESEPSPPSSTSSSSVFTYSVQSTIEVGST